MTARFKRINQVSLINESEPNEEDQEEDEEQSTALMIDEEGVIQNNNNINREEEEDDDDDDRQTMLQGSNRGIRYWIRRGGWKFWKKQRRYEVNHGGEEENSRGREIRLCGRRFHLCKINSWRALFLALFAFSAAMIISVMLSKLLSEPTEIASVKYNGAVSSDAAICAKMSADILGQDGSAVDAAITAMLCNGVVHAESSGIGGGGFMVIRLDNGSVYSINFREMAPMKANKTMFHSDPALSREGGLAVAVPGEVLGMEVAHEFFGKLKWKKLFDPVIKLCKEGFKLTNHTVTYFENNWEDMPVSIRNIYSVTINGTYKKVGDTIKRPNLAKTLKAISEHGAAAFYQDGDIARSIVKSVASSGGIMTMEDLASYEVDVVEPLKTQFGDHTFYSPPAPSGGPVLLFILSLMDRYHLNSSSSSPDLTYHRLVEAFKFGYAERTGLGDPYCNISNSMCPDISREILMTQNKMMDASFVSEIWKNITDNSTHNVSYYNPHFSEARDHGTSHVSVLSSHGDAVAVTTTVNTQFGSHLLTDNGIILNNEMDDFSSPNVGLLPSRTNYIYPRRRPLSSTCPTVAVTSVTSGSSETQPYMVVGGSGGKRILTAVAQVILRAVVFEESISDSIESLRLHHQLLPDFITNEPDFPEEILEFLESRGHQLVEAAIDSVVQGIIVDRDGNVTAHADSRKQGAAVIVKGTS